MPIDMSGGVSYGLLRTSIGELEIKKQYSVENIHTGLLSQDFHLSDHGEVLLTTKLNHKSEDIEMEMTADFTPNEARALAEQLYELADHVEDNREA